MMKGRKIVVCLITLIMLMSTVACRELTADEIRANNFDNWLRFSDDVRYGHLEKIRFAEIFEFDYYDLFDERTRAITVQRFMQSGKRYIIFVATQDEVKFANDNTIYLWPSTLSGRALNKLNYILYREEPDWEIVSLSFPITIDDLVENWSEVLALWHSLGFSFPHPYLRVTPLAPPLEWSPPTETE